MSNLHKKLELLVNVAIIMVAMLLGAVLVRPFYLSPAPPTPEILQNMLIKPGIKLSLSGLE